ncbi:polynucleotide 5 -hydroxyl-kinase grc3 [Fusarium sporotrichioides]|uniref:Polynucleotide 5'-hydroxyl-kinase GRC3 n=1 Tax=Fusarium sporotrichioides TaxID=5514 RepID=A0A395SEC5_FUSSP|nr:polynucleotide 5 -hydroxyl-kinase grc3 [Fusarium sporotrichioides]
MSALSALQARRREAAASPVQTTQTGSESDEKSVTTSVNPYQLLRKDSSQNAAPKTPKKNAVKDKFVPRGAGSPASHSRGVAIVSGNAITLNPELVGASQKVVREYSSFRLSKQNHRVKTGGVMELELSESERFLVLGSFGIRVIQGEVRLAGATLYPSETIEWVHAPHCHAVPVLRTTEETTLELHPDSNARGLRQLGRLSPLFRKIWNEPPETNSSHTTKDSTFKIIRTPEDAPKKCIIQELASPAAWNKKLSSLVATSRKNPSLSTLICGPKSAGKSTFSRLFLNGLLTDRSHKQGARNVVVLDLDPGQPEYAPPGTLSLVCVTKPNLGTPFTHPSLRNSAFTVIRSHSMASATPAPNPDLYLACATDLFDTYSTYYAGAPLIVNTPGWIQGTGLDLLSSLIEKIKPQEVLYMSEAGPSEAVDALHKATKLAFTELPSQQSEFTPRTAAHLRAMQTMSYFHLQNTAPKTSNLPDTPSRLKWNASPLSFRSPLLVQYSSSKRGVLGLLSYDYQCSPELLADTVNGLVLAAVEIEDPKAFSNFPHEGAPPLLVSTSPENIPFIPNYDDVALDPRYSRTVGLVLLRGIDTKSETLQLVTPIPLEELRSIKSQGRSIVLLHGKFDTPNWAYTEELYERAGTDEGNDVMLEVTDEDTEDDQSEVEPEGADGVSDLTDVPWVEVLKGSQRRPVGSRVWRVRRDLGRNNTGD